MKQAPAPTNRKRTSIGQMADQCVKCGLCLPFCPTYVLSGNEAESPRGRIAQAKSVSGSSDRDEVDLLHLDSCLACGACERVCPSRVRYLDLIVAARAHVQAYRRESPRRKVARMLLEHPRAFGWAWQLLRRFDRSSRKMSIQNATDVDVRPMRAGTTDVSLQSVANAPTLRPKVALLTGCTGAALERDTLDATQRLLSSAGMAVTRTRSQCCGALARHSGDLAQAGRLGNALASSLSRLSTDVCTGTVTGCATQYRQIAPEGSAYRDPMVLLWSRRETLRFVPTTKTVALHLPCTQLMDNESVQATKDLLTLVPGLVVITLPNKGRCCGAAGTYFLDHAATASQLQAQAMADVMTSGAAVVLSANIGCRMQLAGSAPQVMHPLQFLSQHLDAKP